MQVSLETISGLERKMTITVGAEQINQAIDHRLKQLAKTVRINGFRPGKVPISMVAHIHGASVHKEILQKVMQDNFEQAIEKYGLRPAGRIQFIPAPSSIDQPLTYQILFEAYPEVVLKDLTSITIEKPKATVSDHDVEVALLQLQRKAATWQKVERPAAAGDKAVIDMHGTIDGKDFDGGSASDFVILLDENKMVEGFVSGIIGHKPGDQFTLNITFPITYRAEMLQGKQALFSIHLKQLEEAILPSWNEDFITTLGLQGKNLEQIKSDMRTVLERSLKQAIEHKIRQQLFAELVALHADLSLPTTLVTEEEQRLLKQYIQQQKKNISDPLSINNHALKAQAHRNVAIRLLLGAIIQQQQITLNNNQVENFLLEVTAQYENQHEVVNYYRRQPAYMDELRSTVLERTVIEALLKIVQVVEKPLSFDEVVY